MPVQHSLQLIDFDSKAKNFVTTVAWQSNNIAQLVIAPRAIAAVIYPYSGMISEFCALYAKHQADPALGVATLLQRATYLQDTIRYMVLPEQFLVQLADAYAVMRQRQQDRALGLVVLAAPIGVAPELLASWDWSVEQVNLAYDFAGLVTAIKTSMATLLAPPWVEFCLAQQLNFAEVALGITIQPWQQAATNHHDVVAAVTALCPAAAVGDFAGFKSKEFARIAVVGIVVFNDQVLLLKQQDDDQLWRPPCGGVHRDEDLIAALVREIYEDTQLTVKVLLPVSIWKSAKKLDGTGLAVVYVCEATSADVVLSAEYTHWQWVDKHQLTKTKLATTFDFTNWCDYIDLGAWWQNKHTT